MEIQISGLEQVQRRLAETPEALVRKAFETALDRAIGVVAAEVEARTPVGEAEELAEAVITRVKLDEQNRGGQAAVGFSSRQSERTGRPLDEIALWVEYGHRMVTHHGQQVGHVPAHPFLRPALASAGDRAIEVFASTLIESLSLIEEPEAA